MDESSLHEKPAEFMTGPTPGVCEAQSVLPDGDHFRCHCSCGGWDTTAATREEGLELARQHTRSTEA